MTPMIFKSAFKQFCKRQITCVKPEDGYVEDTERNF